MRKILPGVVFALLAMVALYPAVFYGVVDDGTTEPEPTTIDRYQAVFEVDEDGDMAVTETLDVRFPARVDRRGIFRFFDESDPEEPRASRLPTSIRVTRDGVDEPYEEISSGNGQFLTLKIGREDTVLEPGVHTYVIRYEMADVLLPHDDGSRLHWNLVPGGWAQPIKEAQLTVRLPEAGMHVRCAVGQADTCGVAGEGTSTLVFNVQDLPPRTAVNARIDLPTTAADAAGHLPWSTRWAQVLGDSWWSLVAILLGVVFAGWYGRRLARRTHEEAPGMPLTYAPPRGVGPMQAVYVTKESVPRQAFVAGLMHAAEEGAISLERDAEDWRVVDRDSATELDEVTSHGLVELGVTPESPFIVDHGDEAAGKQLQTVITSSTARVKEWAKANKLVVRDGPGALGAFGVVAAFVLYGILLWFRLPGSVLALVPGAFAALGLPMLFPGASIRRTPEGRRLWSEIGGFERVLSTPSSEHRFDFSGRHELYAAYIPWAVAFGCADEWAKKYRFETGQEPPPPMYVMGVNGTPLGSVDAITTDFSSSLDGAISAYQATQSSSSGGSSGGGGGGGGGGSW